MDSYTNMQATGFKLIRQGPIRTVSGYRALKGAPPPKDEIELETQTIILPTTTPPVTPYLVFLVFIASLGPFQFGYHLGELNAPQNVITCDFKTLAAQDGMYGLPQCIAMSTTQWGLVQSIFTIGGLTGSLFGGHLATSYGRRVATQLLTAVLLLGSLVQSCSMSFLNMTAGRFISGIGAGAATVVCPIFIAEIAPADKRGLFGAFTQLMINSGILIAQILGYFLSQGSLWRFILATPGAICIVTLVGLLFSPESPKWLVENGQSRTAKIVLQQIRGHGSDIRAEIKDWQISGDGEEQSLLEAPKSTTTGQESSISFFDVITIPKYRKATIAVASAMMAQQLTGINSVVMYSVAILGPILPGAAALITVMVSAANVLVSILSAPLSDKIGRKPCLLLSIAGMGLNSIFLAIGLSRDLPVLTVFGLVFFVCSFGIGLGPVPFILASELTDPKTVGATSSWALASNWMSTFCVAQFFPLLNTALPKGQVYWVFVIVAVAFGAFIAWWVPESRGKANADEVWMES